MWSLKIDTHERKLIDLFERRSPPVEGLVVETMDVGDAQIWQGGQPVMVVERKTVSDFYQSCRDGRYREQKERILASDFLRKVYLIEGANKKESIGSFSEDYMDQVLARLSLKDGISVFFTPGLEETRKWLVMMFGKLRAQPELYGAATSPTSTAYTSLIQTTKKDNITPSNFLILQLKLIRGVSDAVASTVTAHYPSLISLIRALEERGSGCLAELVVGKRRLGGKLAARICEYLLYDEPSSSVSSVSASASASVSVVSSSSETSSDSSSSSSSSLSSSPS
jgi:ERCC4-type nuclease